MQDRRRGITLIELLVVMAIMGTLAGIVALFAPRMLDHARVPEGARQLQSWLQIARQRAVRDGAPRGLRLLSGPPATQPPVGVNPSQAFYSKFAYVEQPADVSVVALEMIATDLSAFQTAAANTLTALANAEAAKSPPDPNLVAFYNTHTTNVQSTVPGSEGWRRLLWIPSRNLQGTFQRGDVIEFASARYYLVCDAVPVKTADCVLVLHRIRDDIRTLSTATALTPLPSGRVTRSPQQIAGEPELDLPKDIAIDVLYTTQPMSLERRSIPTFDTTSPAGTGKFDVMFGPGGEVIGDLGTSGRIVLWVRDISLGEPANGQRGGMTPGDNRLIVIHTRTGQVTGHPVFPEMDNTGKLIDPYKFVRDGKSSAME